MTLVFTQPAEAQDLSGLQIVEGQGLSEVLTIGMDRSSVRAVQASHAGDNGNCVTATTCGFRLSGDTAAISVTFDSNDRVQEIGVVQRGAAIKWATSRGVVDGMSLTEASALYPGSYISGNEMVAEDFGYTYMNRVRCYAGRCSSISSHTLYEADGGDPAPPPPPVASHSFVGAIDVDNPTRRTRTFRIDVAILDPAGTTSTGSIRLRINARSSASINPAEFVSVESATGSYSYEADVIQERRRRGDRLISTSSGDFSIVAD